MADRRGYPHLTPPQHESGPVRPDGVVWPDTDSGFQADQFSPAGEIQAWSQFGRALRRPGALRRAAGFNVATKVLTAVLAGVALLVLIGIAISALVD